MLRCERLYPLNPFLTILNQNHNAFIHIRIRIREASPSSKIFLSNLHIHIVNQMIVFTLDLFLEKPTRIKKNERNIIQDENVSIKSSDHFAQ